MNVYDWRILLILRVTLTLILQTGYIHPDEYFQSLEVLAGDILHLDVHRPWEFNVTSTKNPIRSIVVPSVTVGLPLIILRQISSLLYSIFGFTIISPYLVLLSPRLVITALSITSDVCLYRICRLFKRNHVKCLTVYASSYVALIYMTRTLSNSVEVVLFAFLLYEVATCMHETDKILLRDSKKEKVIHLETSKCSAISLLLTVGVFNRPTFVAFAFVPVVTWIFYGYDIRIRNIRKFAERSASLLLGILITSMLFILCDTLYYFGVHYEGINIEILTNTRWVIAPLNFILYNTNKANLAQHGLHPPYTHLLINIPLLFGILGIIGLLDYLKLNFTYLQKHKYTMHAIDKLMNCSFIVPLLLLSVIPHQEPRFIIALLFPLAFLHGEKLFKSKVRQIFWILGNCFGCLFYGYLHQGGIVPSLIHLESLAHIPGFHSSQVIYFHTYMPPRFLLMNQEAVALSKPNFHVNDVMGGSLQELQLVIESLQNPVDVILICPTSLQKDVTALLQLYGAKLEVTFTWHISMEDLPPINQLFFAHIGLDMFKFTTPISAFPP